MDDPTNISLYTNLSCTYSDLGDYDNAEEYLKKAILLGEKIYSSNHYEVASLYSNASDLYKSMGNLEIALNYAKKALNIQENSCFKDAESIGIIYCNLGEIYECLGDKEKSLEYYNKSLISFSLCLSENDSHIEVVNKKIQNLFI